MNNRIFDGRRSHLVIECIKFYGLIPVCKVQVNGQRRCASCGEIIDHDEAFYRNGRFYCNSESCIRDGYNQERFEQDQFEYSQLGLVG